MRRITFVLASLVLSLVAAETPSAPNDSELLQDALRLPDQKDAPRPISKADMEKVGEVAESILERLGLTTRTDFDRRRAESSIASFQSDDVNSIVDEAARDPVDLQGIASGHIPGYAPIPVPGFPGPQDVPSLPGIGSLVPQMIPPTNSLIGSSISRLLPKDATKNLAKDIFRMVHPAAENVDVTRMMGRWYQVINSPHVIREACTISHFGALTNSTYSSSFTIIKYYREGNANGPPRYSVGYGFRAGETGQFVLHNSNSPDSEPFWVIKKGPLNEFNQYAYAIVSNWVRYPVFVIARDPDRFRKEHMKDVLQFLEDNNYINVMTKAFNLISPVDYAACQYTPTFSTSG